MLEVKDIPFLLRNCIFEDLCESNYYKNVISNIDDNKIAWETGATKLILFPQDSNFVIKIPFCGEMYDDFNGLYAPFVHAKEPNKWDYCKAESLIYRSAILENLDTFFAETKYIGSVNNHPIYIQEKVSIFFESKNSKYYSKEESKKIRNLCSRLDLYCFHPYWLSDFLKFYTKESLIKLQNFLRFNYIQDLHGGNLGYRANGMPVIIDYGDYYE